MDTSTSDEDSENACDPPALKIEVTAEDPDQPARQWVETITTLLSHRTQETDPSDRVQFALDMMFVAACERLTRLLRGDLPSE